MRRALIATIAGMVGVIGVVGCNNKKSSIPTNESVTDITPAPAHTPAPVAHSTEPAQPVVYDSMQTTSSGAIGAGNYTVKKGDTLYSIAKSRYGQGNQWQRIAAANPGLEPSKLKVGQTIVIP